MKQWRTVDRAREGMNALQILRYYYGNRVQLVTTDNIAAIDVYKRQITHSLNEWLLLSQHPGCLRISTSFST